MQHHKVPNLQYQVVAKMPGYKRASRPAVALSCEPSDPSSDHATLRRYPFQERLGGELKGKPLNDCRPLGLPEGGSRGVERTRVEWHEKGGRRRGEEGDGEAPKFSSIFSYFHVLISWSWWWWPWCLRLACLVYVEKWSFTMYVTFDATPNDNGGSLAIGSITD